MKTYLLVHTSFGKNGMKHFQPGTIVCAFDCHELDANQLERISDALGCLNGELMTPEQHRKEYPEIPPYSHP